MKQVFLIATHLINEHVLNQYYSVKKAVREEEDVILLIHYEGEKGDLNIPEDISYFIFNYEMLSELDFSPIRESLIPGSNHFPVLLFSKIHPEYDYYWNIEYDVTFSGNWQVFFKAFEPVDADFITCHIRSIREEPEWDWWSTFRLTDKYFIPQSDWLRSFNPIYRISGQALNYLDTFLKEENEGHHEVLLPTVLNYNGFKVLDFGGSGKFVLPGFENKFYTSLGNIYGLLEQGTMRFRPFFYRISKNDHKLYHPVKFQFLYLY